MAKRVAVVHDWLVVYAGAERVLEQILILFPQADLFSLVDFLPEDQRGFLRDKKVNTSFVQKLPFARKKYRQYLPLMPLAVEQFDLTRYDLVISSSHAVAKGVLTGPDQLHICMCHTPLRYAWDLQHQYLQEMGLDRGLKSLAARVVLHKIRMWDYRTANSVDSFIANSKYVARRIWKYYRRKAKVIYPPVDVNRFVLGQERDDFYLTASRMVPYKRMDLIVDAFTQLPHKKLVVIGDGPEFTKLRSRARSNVSFLGYQPEKVLREHMQKARAFVFAAEEDFGIVPLEAQACGTPVIAYGKGGILETIRGLDDPEPTGVLFPEQSIASLHEAVEIFEKEENNFSREACRSNALRFASERFQKEFMSFVRERCDEFDKKKGLFEQ